MIALLLGFIVGALVVAAVLTAGTIGLAMLDGVCRNLAAVTRDLARR